MMKKKKYNWQSKVVAQRIENENSLKINFLILVIVIVIIFILYLFCIRFIESICVCVFLFFIGVLSYCLGNSVNNNRKKKSKKNKKRSENRTVKEVANESGFVYLNCKSDAREPKVNSFMEWLCLCVCVSIFTFSLFINSMYSYIWRYIIMT